VSNINNSALNERVHRHIRSAEEKKQEKYGDAAKRRGAHFVPAVFSAQGGWGERWTKELYLPWLDDEIERVKLSPDPWENEWSVHRRVREMATLLGCEIARQNGQMVERVVNYQQRHSNKSRYSMRAWQWGEAIDYSLMSRLADTRRDMIADYRREKSIAGRRRRPYAY
jgi:hypothetical protein